MACEILYPENVMAFDIFIRNSESKFISKNKQFFFSKSDDVFNLLTDFHLNSSYFTRTSFLNKTQIIFTRGHASGKLFIFQNCIYIAPHTV